MSATPVAVATENATRTALRTLGTYRLFAPASQAVTIAATQSLALADLPLRPIAVLLAIEFAIACLTWSRLRSARRVSRFELFAQTQLDILAFSAMLYFTGGAANPFAPLCMLPAAISGTALPARWIWTTSATTIAVYALLIYTNHPLTYPETASHYLLHEHGEAVAHIVTLAILTFFYIRILTKLRDHERMLGDARDVQARSESVVAIGALAAGHAHELNSMLAAMTVVTHELRHDYADDARLREDLDILADRIEASATIVVNMVRAAQWRREDVNARVGVDVFVREVADRVRALNPGTTIDIAFTGQGPAPLTSSDVTLRQAITHLLDNAAHACPDQVSITTDWSGPMLHVVVRDRGPGFPREFLDSLGREIRSTRGAGGTGLGLVLTAVTLDRLGGRLELSNPTSGGARVDLWVPMRAIAANPSPH